MNTAAVWLGLYGAWRLACRDRGAPQYFEASVAGVLRSFWAGAICYPGFFILLLLRPDAPQGGVFLHGLIIQSIGYVIQWTAYPLMALPFCRWLAPEERALGFIAAYNWSQVLQTGLVIASALIGASQIFPPELAAWLDATVYLVCLVYEWFIARIMLDAGGLPATALVLLDVVVSAIVIQVSQMAAS
jgi:hypothetical protein